MLTRLSLPGAIVLASMFAAVPAFAQQPPAAAAPAAAEPAPMPEPPASQLAAARDVVIASGMSRSFIVVVPDLMNQVGTTLTRTRPELVPDVQDVMHKLQPDFEKQSDEMIDDAARILCTAMTEDELKQTAAFFHTPVGQKYMQVQPIFLDRLVVTMEAWSNKLSVYITTRVREEMQARGKPI